MGTPICVSEVLCHCQVANLPCELFIVSIAVKACYIICTGLPLNSSHQLDSGNLSPNAVNLLYTGFSALLTLCKAPTLSLYSYMSLHLPLSHSQRGILLGLEKQLCHASSTVREVRAYNVTA